MWSVGETCDWSCHSFLPHSLICALNNLKLELKPSSVSCNYWLMKGSACRKLGFFFSPDFLRWLVSVFLWSCLSVFIRKNKPTSPNTRVLRGLLTQKKEAEKNIRPLPGNRRVWFQHLHLLRYSQCGIRGDEQQTIVSDSEFVFNELWHLMIFFCRRLTPVSVKSTSGSSWKCTATTLLLSN